MHNSVNLANMFNNINVTKNTTVGFGGGTTDLFLQVQENGEIIVLDYEYDSEEIHRICGGRQYYRSRSGMSGKGWIKSYGSLIPVGYYRTDVRNFDWINSVEVDDGIAVMLPYQAHTQEKNWWAHPVVVTRTGKYTGDVVVYTTMSGVVDAVKALRYGREETLGEIREYTKSFVDEQGYTTKVAFKFVNDWGGRSFNPWSFAKASIRAFACYEWAGVWGVFGLTRLGQDFYCRKYWFAGQYYRGERIEGLTDEAFEEGGEALAPYVPEWDVMGRAARRSTRDGKSYQAVAWSTPQAYKQNYIPKIIFDTADVEEMRELMGCEEATDNGGEEE